MSFISHQLSVRLFSLCFLSYLFFLSSISLSLTGIFSTENNNTISKIEIERNTVKYASIHNSKSFFNIFVPLFKTFHTYKMVQNCKEIFLKYINSFGFKFHTEASFSRTPIFLLKDLKVLFCFRKTSEP